MNTDEIVLLSFLLAQPFKILLKLSLLDHGLLEALFPENRGW